MSGISTCMYCISENVDSCFNLAVWQITFQLSNYSSPWPCLIFYLLGANTLLKG